MKPVRRWELWVEWRGTFWFDADGDDVTELIREEI